MILKANISKYKFDFLAILLISLTLPLFFYKLGQSSLVSFDEAWYADIARNILKTGNFLDLSWNGQNYVDHPPAGFWLIAISQKIFGFSEFAARFGPSISGFLTLIIIYFLGRELFNRWVGVVSSIALSSSTWFMFRARSGNLDTILTLFFVLTIFLAIKSCKESKYLTPFTLSSTLLALTKTMVPLMVMPALIVIFWGVKRLKIKEVVLSILIFAVIFGWWFYAQLDNHDHFIQRFLQIGLPGVKAETSIIDNFELMKEYIHNGVGKWFWPGVLGLFGGLFFKQKRFLVLSIFSFSFFAPFLFSNKGHIWHLIPLHPFMILAFFGFAYTFIEKSTKVRILAILFVVLFSGYFSFIQTRRNWYEFIDVPAFVSDEAILSKEAGKYPYKFYIDGDFGPAAVYYSEKNVQKIWEGGLKNMFKSDEKFVLITNDWKLEKEQIPETSYKLVKKDRDKVFLVKE